MGQLPFYHWCFSGSIVQFCRIYATMLTVVVSAFFRQDGLIPENRAVRIKSLHQGKLTSKTMGGMLF